MTPHDPTARLRAMLADSPYQAYVYGYPHKTAYRTFPEPKALRTLWKAEPHRNDAYLYVHIPFCEMRCGFCNLFTSVKPGGDFVADYGEALRRQAEAVSGAIGDVRFARFAMGGGTPTHLPSAALEAVFDLVERTMGADLHQIPASVECSPETATQEKLALLRRRGVDRISMGVQSFVPAEVEAIHRRQDMTQVRAALERMKALAFPCVNIDLMYGLPGQTEDSWRTSLREALAFEPAEIFLYPLYVRPLTRMGAVSPASWDDQRLRLYRLGRDLLVSAGYDALSMRVFRRRGAAPERASGYNSVTHPMVGLGCGARSYTASTHYSSAYAVGPGRVKQIIRDYITASEDAFRHTTYGFVLDSDEQRRRAIILGLISDENSARGLDLERYKVRFGTQPLDDFKALGALEVLGLAHIEDNALKLTPTGVERSDTLGAWLFSPRVEALMGDYTTR